MRLTCPACGATYDVPEDAIPLAGREVECSECGAVWQARRAAAATSGAPGSTVEQVLARAVRDAPSVPAAGAGEAAADYLPEDEPARPEEARAAAVAAQSPTSPPSGGEEYLPEAAESEEEDEEEDSPPPFAATPPPRRKLDDSILRILREEAEREARARAAERAPVETQPELGLTEAPRPRPAPITPPAPPLPAATPAAPAAAEPPAAAPAAVPDTAPPAPAQKKRIAEPVAETPAAPSRFGTGFLLAVGLAAVALYAYAAAPGIVTEFPALGPGLEAYVAAVDALRLWLAEALADLRAPRD